MSRGSQYFRVFYTLLCYWAVSLLPAQEAQQTIPPCPANFLMDAIISSQGEIWVAAEDAGVWKLNTSTQEWLNMSQIKGFPETKNCYTIAEDQQHRIWVGTDNQGVIVWNGDHWKQYTQLEGLIGERVFDIAIDPSNGVVAIATSGGITLYDPKTNTWRDITRAEGLTEDQIESLCFTPEGKLFLGYACGGTSISSNNQYNKWIHSQTKWFWDKKQYIRQPLTYSGDGLPSNLCNVVLALTNNQFWVGTNSGIAKSTNGRNWIFLRGEDALAKNEGLYGGIPPGTSKTKPNMQLLLEDFITALFPCPEGIWVGFREKGACLIDPINMSIKAHSSVLNAQTNARAKWVRQFLHLPTGEILAATNGGGIQKVGNSQVYKLPLHPPNIPQHPRPIAAPSDQEIALRMRQMASPPSPALTAAFWYEDWATQGDWCQRYGRRYALLCAANSPKDNIVFQFDLNRKHDRGLYDYSVKGFMGPHRQQGDSLRHWVHWINKPENRNILYNPAVAIRTEAEWDDQGEAYQRNFDGPDVWAIVYMPEGIQTISLYFYNPNGREETNGYRDYIVELRKVSAPVPGEKIELNIKDVLSLPVQARTRVNHFAGSGVYKTFIVQGGLPYYIRICRNYSMNTILNGVFLNTRKELDIESSELLNYKGAYQYGENIPNPPDISLCDISQFPRSALQLWGKVQQQNSVSKHPLFLLRKNLLLAYRKNINSIQDPNNLLLKNWRWQLRLWLQEDHHEFDSMMQQDWYNKQETYSLLCSQEWCPYSPRVIPFSPKEICWIRSNKENWKDFLPDNGKRNNPEEIKQTKAKIKRQAQNQEKTKYD